MMRQSKACHVKYDYLNFVKPGVLRSNPHIHYLKLEDMSRYNEYFDSFGISFTMYMDDIESSKYLANRMLTDRIIHTYSDTVTLFVKKGNYSIGFKMVDKAKAFIVRHIIFNDVISFTEFRISLSYAFEQSYIDPLLRDHNVDIEDKNIIKLIIEVYSTLLMFEETIRLISKSVVNILYGSMKSFSLSISADISDSLILPLTAACV